MGYDNFTLGCIGEIQPVNFIIMEEQSEIIIGSLHRIAIRELMSRRLVTMWDWEIRTKHMFENNNLHTIRDVIGLSSEHVNRLKGCGYKTRKEVYDNFIFYHIKLNHWSPDKHWYKANYRFKE